MERYVDTVSRLAFRMLCDHSDSEDVTTMVFDTLSKRKKPDRMTLRQWLITQTVRFSRKRYRYNRIMNFLGKSHKLFVQTAPKVDDVDDYITTQAWEIYCRASEDLTFDQRVIYVLMEIEEISEEEIMLVTGFWKGTVRMNLEFARLKVRAELAKFGKVAEYDSYVGFLRRVQDSKASCSMILNSLYLQAEPEI